jgi:hypothetical protein
MEIYLEYAFLENFLVDACILYLALSASRLPISIGRVCLGGVVGAGFALLFPLLTLPEWLAYLLKFAVGALLCLLASKPNRAKKGGLPLTVCMFYAFSFCLGGGLIAIFEGFDLPYYTLSGGGVLSTLPVGVLLFACVVFVALGKTLIRKIYARKRRVVHIVSCSIFYKDAHVRVDGFLDTGNTARYDGRAVCFVTPDVIYRLFELSPPTASMPIRTVSGERTIPLYLADELRLCAGEEKTVKGVYLSPSVHILGKEYQILLQGEEFCENFVKIT